MCEDTDKKALTKFHELYVTATEICESLGVSRAAVHYRHKHGNLPGCISLQKVHVWEREQITPHIERWKQSLEQRGAGAN